MRKFLDRIYLGAAYLAATCVLLIMLLMIAQSILREMHAVSYTHLTLPTKRIV